MIAVAHVSAPASLPGAPEVAPHAPTAAPLLPPAFDDVYDEHFDFVWRFVRRLGIPAALVDDVVQEIFVVVHRRLADFEGRSSLKTWLSAVVVRVVRDHRRRFRRTALAHDEAADPESLVDAAERGPHERAAQAEAARIVHRLLDELDDDKREVLALAELEQMEVPAIAEALGINLNTAYSRLRAARAAFQQAVARHHARDGWRLR